MFLFTLDCKAILKCSTILVHQDMVLTVVESYQNKEGLVEVNLEALVVSCRQDLDTKALLRPNRDHNQDLSAPPEEELDECQ